jgi:hypothetical protein
MQGLSQVTIQRLQTETVSFAADAVNSCWAGYIYAHPEGGGSPQLLVSSAHVYVSQDLAISSMDHLVATLRRALRLRQAAETAGLN